MSNRRNIKITIEYGDRFFERELPCCCERHMLGVAMLVMTNYIARDLEETKFVRATVNDPRVLAALDARCRISGEKSSDDRLADREVTTLALSVFRDLVRTGVATIEGPLAETAPAILDRLLEGKKVEISPLPPLPKDVH